MLKGIYYGNRRFLLYLAIMLFATVAFATAGDLVDIPGSDWDTKGKGKLSVKGAGKAGGHCGLSSILNLRVVATSSWPL